MLATLKTKRLLWPTFMTLVGVAILIGLGTWQIHRLVWKEELLANISQRAHGEPIALERAEHLERASGDIEYLRVRTEGQFLFSTTRSVIFLRMIQNMARAITSSLR